jgi:hypothetical protein
MTSISFFTDCLPYFHKNEDCWLLPGKYYSMSIKQPCNFNIVSEKNAKQ